MKRLTLAAALASALLFIPTASFALVDVNLYGGYTFSGKLEGISGTQDGWEMGLTTHINFDVLVFFQFGAGASYEWTNMDWTDKNQVGLDLYGMLNIPFIPVSPYVRFNTAIWDKIEGQLDSTEYFKTYSFGGGIILTVLPIPGVFKLQLFGEYMYNFSEHSSREVTDHSFYLGVRTDFL